MGADSYRGEEHRRFSEGKSAFVIHQLRKSVDTGKTTPERYTSLQASQVVPSAENEKGNGIYPSEVSRVRKDEAKP